MSTSSSTERGHAAGAVLGLSLLLTLLVTAFAWPASRLAPHDLPVAVVAPPAQAAQVGRAIARAHPGAFAVTRVDTPAAAARAVRRREVYGALVLGPRPEVLTASAASPVVAQMLDQAAASLAPPPTGAAAGEPTSHDVVALPKDDPHGAVFDAGSLPVVLASIITALVLTLRFRGRGVRLAGAAGVAVLGGLGATAVLQPWLGALDGAFLANWGILALGILAVVCCPLGLAGLLGRPGLVLGVAAIVLLSVPLSGVTSAPELLPAGWSELGRLMPVGALGTGLRSTAFFDGNGLAAPLVVLLVWAVVGAACAAVPLRAGYRWRSASLAIPSR